MPLACNHFMRLQTIGIDDGSWSCKVVISLIATCQRSNKYDEFIIKLKEQSKMMSPFVIQQLIKHNPNQKSSLLEDIKEDRFPKTTVISQDHLPFLGMYSREEIEDFLMTSERVHESVIKEIEERGWDTIHQKTIERSESRFCEQWEK